MFRTVVCGLTRAMLALPLMAFGPACSSAAASTSRSSAAGTPQAHVGAIAAKYFVARVSNPYFPLAPGTTLIYRGEKDGKSAIDEFSVTHERKTIQGVRTTVVHDVLLLAGRVAEVTTDWYAQDRRGNVWYFGEARKTLKPNGGLEGTEGSWQAGVKGARAGIFFPGSVRVGQEGQQEFFKGHAEDHFKILSPNATVKVPAVSTNRAVRTREWTPLEPTVLDNKYYVKGIGTVLELAVRGPAERLELTSVRR
jgi:hypothetical protein